MAVTRLEVLKALGDTTRYALYLELARSSQPLSTAELAERLDLHINTVRPHLERMREVGLLDLHADARGGVGRPQHRYGLAAEAPALGLEPPVMPALVSMVLRLAERVGASGDDAAAIGQSQGAADAALYADAPSSLEALVAELDRWGFDPLVSDGIDVDEAVVGFGHCPFQSVAETHPDIVCSLHRGLVTGFIERMGDAEVERFCTLVDRTPCQVAISTR